MSPLLIYYFLFVCFLCHLWSFVRSSSFFLLLFALILFLCFRLCFSRGSLTFFLSFSSSFSFFSHLLFSTTRHTYVRLCSFLLFLLFMILYSVSVVLMNFFTLPAFLCYPWWLFFSVQFIFLLPVWLFSCIYLCCGSRILDAIFSIPDPRSWIDKVPDPHQRN